jgi:hypothetical protein
MGMSPNAMANQRAVQLTQLKALQAATGERLTTVKAARGFLDAAVEKIDSISKIPALTDVHKIGDAIKFLAMSQVVQANLNIKSLEAESKTLEDAIQQAESPIARVSIGG